MNKIVKNCFAGLYALIQDPCGVLALLVLFIVSFLCYKGKVSDIAFAAVCSVLPVVIAAIKHSSFSGSDIDNGKNNILQEAEKIIGVMGQGNR
jgi:hypothetical protein